MQQQARGHLVTLLHLRFYFKITFSHFIGKLLNVREASHKQIMDNKEITDLVKIIGLQYKKKYLSIEDMNTLRYGRMMIMTDQV